MYGFTLGVFLFGIVIGFFWGTLITEWEYRERKKTVKKIISDIKQKQKERLTND